MKLRGSECQVFKVEHAIAKLAGHLLDKHRYVLVLTKESVLVAAS